ncbi:MAG: UDP-N-acetylmuramoyl-tripeptide--D-alanyl-D-alanine ligase [Opitutaceae bacterium]
MYDYALDELATITKGTWLNLADTVSVSSFCFDARQLNMGDCFVALTGGVRDGHDFIEQAKLAGAGAAIVERAVDVDIPQLLVSDSLLALGAIGAAARLRFENPVVGVTGSCGKTSTKEMLRLLLGEAVTQATAGNWNNRIGVPMTLMDLDASQHQFGVIEAGINQPGEMELLGNMIGADLTIITNVGPAHLELLGTIENVAIEKAWLPKAAKTSAPVIFPSGLLQYHVFRAMAEKAIVLHPEGEPLPEVQVQRLVTYRLRHEDANRMVHVLTLTENSQEVEYVVNTPSRGIATNAALAIVAAQALGISIDEAQQRIAQWQPASNRGRVITQNDQTFYVDCYNANPTSMTDALSAFVVASDDAQPRTYILGAMNELGATAIREHEAIGSQLRLEPHDRAIFVGPEALVGAYEAGALSSGNSRAQIKTGESIGTFQSEVAQCKGALFLKGSRSYQLEKLLPESTNQS